MRRNGSERTESIQTSISERKGSGGTAVSSAGYQLKKTSTGGSSFGKSFFNGRKLSNAMASDDGNPLEEVDSQISLGSSMPHRLPSIPSSTVEFEANYLPPDSIGGFLGPLMQTIPNDAPKDSKRRKPKNSLTKNSSSYVSRTIVSETLNKRINDRAPDDWFLWVNVGRSFNWIDASLGAAANGTRKEPLSKILFTKSHPLCHDVNQYTRATNNIDMVLGMSSGDAIWFDAYSNRYNRLNKNGDIIRSAVTDIKWVPGSSNYFVTTHANGSLIIFDKEREDGRFAMNGGLNHQDLRSTETFRIVKSLKGDPAGVAATSAAAAKEKEKYNPIAMYKMSNRALTSVTFSPDRQTLVVTSNDGFMRFLDLGTETVTDIFPSYYDGILCAAFSPDGLYLATGGQDDLVTIWNVKKKTVVARGYGHQSWVRRVAFDQWNCDEFNYRVGSVGEDGNLILWDFAPKNLARPKAQRRKDESGAVPTSSHVSTLAAGDGEDKLGADHDVRGNTNGHSHGNGKFSGQGQGRSIDPSVLHPFLPNKLVPTIPPVQIQLVKDPGEPSEGLCDLVFMEDEIIVSGKDGRIWSWRRPDVNPIGSL